MAERLHTASAGFEEAFAALLAARRGMAVDVDREVAAIIADVRTRGDAALAEHTERLDGFVPDASAGPGVSRFAVSAGALASAVRDCPAHTLEALHMAAARIRSYHERQMPRADRFTDAQGVELGHRWTAVRDVGLYVPGGSASYPSSVLMNAIPARVAGVGRIAMAVPAPGGEVNPLTLAAAHIAGVDEVYLMGGAQAIAALAFGTGTIGPVDKIAGPGNAYVSAAKRQVFGIVGIDLIAGPSEVLVVADADNDPAWIAADLLAQAEHDPSSQSILITDDAGFADAVTRALEGQLAGLARRAVAGASWESFGAVIVADDLSRVPALVDRLAPEHLELAVADPDALLAQISHAGAIFLGAHTPEAIGDYIAGTNHVLPTARTARFASGLSVPDFMKRSSIVRCTAESLGRIGPAAITLAEAEGLGAHARSVSIRLNVGHGR